MRLFDRAAIETTASLLAPFYIAGELANGRAGDAYSCRIPFFGNIGDVVVRSWSGDMPPATALWIDNTTNHLVVEYPAYQAEDITEPVPIINADFAAGADGWTPGAGWELSGGVAFYLGHGDSLLVSDTIVECPVGRSITASVDVAQGASKAGNCGAAIRIIWYDANRNPIDYDTGNFVDSSDDPPFTSTCTAIAPPGTAYVGLGVHGFRRRERKEMHVDNVTWNHYATVGGISDTTFCLAATLRDEAGRDAVFSDCMNVVFAPSVVVFDRVYKFDPTSEAFTFLSTLPFPAGRRSHSNLGVTAATSADGLVFWWNTTGGASTDYVGHLDTNTMSYNVVTRSAPTITAGAGKSLRPWLDKTWLIALPTTATDDMDVFKWNAGTSNYDNNGTGILTGSGAIQTRNLVWSPDGSKFAVVDGDGWLRVYSFNTSTGAIALLQTLSGGNTGLAWRGNYIFVTNHVPFGNNLTRVFNATTYALVASISNTAPPYIVLPTLDMRWLYVAVETSANNYSIEALELDIGAGTLVRRSTTLVGANLGEAIMLPGDAHLLTNQDGGIGQKLYRLAGSVLTLAATNPLAGAAVNQAMYRL